MKRSAIFENLSEDQLVNRPVLQSLSSASTSDISQNICQCSCCQQVDVEENMMNFEEDSEGDISPAQEDGVKNEDPKFTNYFLPTDAAGTTGSIPRAHISDVDNKKLRPQLPLPGTLERTRNESGTHYYASAATLQRDRPLSFQNTLQGHRVRPVYDERQEHVVPRPPPPSLYGNYLTRRDLEDPMDVYAKKMNSYFFESSKKNSERKQLEGMVGAIGFMGVIVSLAIFIAYLAIQAPHIRKVIGPFYATDYHISREEEANEMKRLEPPTTNVLYGVELGCGIFIGVMMIVTDCLMIHGVRRRSSPFLIPWLFFHGFVILGLGAITILILAFTNPSVFKSLAIVPIVVGILLILCWIKVFQLFQIQRKRFKRPKPKKSHYNPNMLAVNPYTIKPKIPKPDY